MLPAVVEEAIREVAEDRTSGASKLARLAVETMGLAIVDAKGRPDPKELAEVARRTLANALSDADIPATVVPDAEGASLLARASCALIGADSVLRDAAVVNKVGTHGLARAAADRKKPFYVACETLKFDARYDVTSWPGLLSRDASGPPKADEGTSATYHDFEITPAHLVTMLITERGSYTPELPRTMLSSGRDRATRNAG